MNNLDGQAAEFQRLIVASHCWSACEHTANKVEEAVRQGINPEGMGQPNEMVEHTVRAYYHAEPVLAKMVMSTIEDQMVATLLEWWDLWMWRDWEQRPRGKFLSSKDYLLECTSLGNVRAPAPFLRAVGCAILNRPKGEWRLH